MITTRSVKPDIDFSPLLQDRIMGLAKLRAIFGRDLRRSDFDHCKALFATKHPTLRAQLHTDTRHGLRLMTQAEASQYRARQCRSTTKSLVTNLHTVYTMPTDQLTIEERKDHEARALECADVAVKTMTAAKKELLLPSGGQKP